MVEETLVAGRVVVIARAERRLVVYRVAQRREERVVVQHVRVATVVAEQVDRTGAPCCGGFGICIAGDCSGGADVPAFGGVEFGGAEFGDADAAFLDCSNSVRTSTSCVPMFPPARAGGLSLAVTFLSGIEGGAADAGADGTTAGAGGCAGADFGTDAADGVSCDARG